MSRKSIVQLFSVAAILIAVRLLIDLAGAAAYVFPEYDFGQFWLALLIFVASLSFAVVVAIRRLLQKRVLEGLTFFAILIVPFLFSKLIDGHNWKFRLHKLEYQATINSNPSPAPRFHVFNWGNRNTHLMGGGFVVEAIIYDESDEISRPPNTWSAEWLERRSNSSKDDLWITQIPKSNHPCKRTTKAIDTHFYFVSEDCE